MNIHLPYDLSITTAKLVVPSQDAIYNAMLEDSSKIRSGGVEGVEGSTIASFLNEGLKIQGEQ